MPAALVGAQLISLIAWFALTRAGLLALNVAEPKTGQISKYPCETMTRRKPFHSRDVMNRFPGKYVFVSGARACESITATELAASATECDYAYVRTAGRPLRPRARSWAQRDETDRSPAAL